MLILMLMQLGMRWCWCLSYSCWCWFSEVPANAELLMLISMMPLFAMEFMHCWPQASANVYSRRTGHCLCVHAWLFYENSGIWQLLCLMLVVGYWSNWTVIQSETNNNKQIKIVNASKLAGSCLVLLGPDMTEHFVSISQQTTTVFVKWHWAFIMGPTKKVAFGEILKKVALYICNDTTMQSKHCIL